MTSVKSSQRPFAVDLYSRRRLMCDQCNHLRSVGVRRFRCCRMPHWARHSVALGTHSSKNELKSVNEPSGPSGRSLSWFLQHEATRRISTPPQSHCESSVLPKSTNQCLRPRHEAGPLNPESGALTKRTLRLPQNKKGWFTVEPCLTKGSDSSLGNLIAG